MKNGETKQIDFRFTQTPIKSIRIEIFNTGLDLEKKEHEEFIRSCLAALVPLIVAKAEGIDFNNVKLT